MSGETAQARDWVETVLGVALPEPGQAGRAARFEAARTIWQRASVAAEAQLAALRDALRAAGDPALAEVAESGLPALAKGFQTPIAEAFDAAEGADFAPGAFRRLARVIEGVERFVAEDARIAACDQNPVGATVSLQATLGAALGGMRQAIGEAG